MAKTVAQPPVGADHASSVAHYGTLRAFRSVGAVAVVLLVDRVAIKQILFVSFTRHVLDTSSEGSSQPADYLISCSSRLRRSYPSRRRKIPAALIAK